MPLARVLVRVLVRALATLAPMVGLGGGVGDLAEELLDMLEGGSTVNLGRKEYKQVRKRKRNVITDLS